MEIKQCFVMAIRNLLVNRLRFLHAMLGMVIGIAGFLLALAVGNLSLAAVGNEQVEYDPGVLKADVWIRKDSAIQFQYEDVLDLAAENPEVIKGISPVMDFEFNGGVRYGERREDEARVYGVNESYLEMIPAFRLEVGRFLNEREIAQGQRVCVVGSSIANDTMGGEALGQTLKIWGLDYTVVGVFAEVPNESYPHRNVEVCIPYTTAIKVLGGEAYRDFGDPGTDAIDYSYKYYLCANGKENMYQALELFKERLREKTGHEQGKGWNTRPSGIGDISDQIRGYIIGDMVRFSLFSGLILLVGGAGVMNVMLASVQARTKEIGIRKAFGATVGDIQRQFFVEAIITGLIGGLAGVAIGLAGILYMFFSAESPLSYLYSIILPVLLAMGASMAVGVIFGTYPARQAAKLEIVEALNEG